ncbi:hypothetical protein ANN_25953 [Periplaneta americana]|uniref:Exportin-2 n=1 Tax=Periplaneta americana TaxID=6978 RepID=A0ABQ8S4Z9_PERAM|nr:hypothetical protein ANN_25953 [Periplaneta americana]
MAGLCEGGNEPPGSLKATSDEELFEDNPEEYICRDIEGSDVDTRRRAACDLVKVLSRYFEERMTQVFSSYVQVMLQSYKENPMQNWRGKDTVLYLVTSLASKGQTQRHGITQTSQLVDLNSFATEHILPELQKDDVNTLPVLKADSIKYIMIFRSVLPREMVVGSIPQLVRHLSATSQVVHTYAACAIEKILVMKASDGTAVVKSEELVPIAPDLLNNLFRTMTMHGSQENEYVMKAVMRSFSALQARVIPFLSELLPKLTEKLAIVSRNPSRPHFNHYLFETLSISIKIVCTADANAVSSFEEALFPIFQGILQQDVQEFVPYVFQILSLLLEQHNSGTIPEPYMVLFPCLLAPVLWERPGNIHPLVRLLQAFIHTGAAQISASEKVSGLLGVFQKLIASKVNDHEGFYLLQSLIEHFPDNNLSPYMRQVFVLLFHRLSSSRTTKFVRGLIVFFTLYAIKYGASNLIAMLDSIQPEMFGKVLEKVIIPDVQKISGNVERKIAAVGITKLLCDTKEMMDGSYANLWAPLLQALIGLFELPEDESTLPDDHFIEVEDTPGYQAAYSQLAFANKLDHDPLQGRFPFANRLERFIARFAKNHLKLRDCIRGLSKKYPTLNFPAQSSDSKAAPLCTVEGGTVMRMLEFFHRIRLCQSLAGGRQLGDSQSQTIRKIQQVFGEDAMGVTQIMEWFNRLKDGRTSAESEQHCGRPQTVRSGAVVERVRNLVMADRRLTVREIAEEIGVSKDSAHAILRDDLNMNRVAAKFVPKLLSPKQKDLRRDVAQDLLDTANTDPGNKKTVVAMEASRVSKAEKAQQVRSKIKVMLTVFFDVRGIVHHEYAPEGQTVTKEYYHDVLRRLRDAVRRKRPDMWTANNWHLHHDNAPAHSSQLIHTFLAKHGITTVRQPPYSPDLAPCDFWLFPKLKTPLKGSRFESREEIMRNVTTELNTIPKEDFQRCFRQWKDRWAKCVQAQGAYFEGD